MSEKPNGSNSDPEATQTSLRAVPGSSGRATRSRARLARMSTRTRVLGGLLVLAMIILGSVLVFSAILPASDPPAPAAASTNTSQPPTIQPSPSVVQPSATRAAASPTSPPQPSATQAATVAATDAAPIEPTSTTPPTVPPTQIPTSQPSSNVDASSAAATDLLDRINNLRSQNGLSPYRLNDALTKAALLHSQDMANTGRIDHSGSDGSNARQRVQDAGYGNWPAGEIIYGGQVTLDDAWAYWSTDPPHLANLLSKQYREMGVGIITSGNLTYYTVDFGGHPRQ